MKKNKNDLGGSKPINIIAIFILLVAIFLLVNVETHTVNFRFPQLSSGQVIPEIFWGSIASILGSIVLIIGLARN